MVHDPQVESISEDAMLMSAYKAFNEAFDWLDPHPPKQPDPIKAMHCIEDWLTEFNEWSQRRRALVAPNPKKMRVSVFDIICDMLADGKVNEVDCLLSMIDTRKIDKSVLLSFLVATCEIAREKLPSRSLIYDACLLAYTDTRGLSEANHLLERYR